jgi:hypothetical protein
MRFMIFRMADQDTEAGVLPQEELFAAMTSYMEEMHKAGIVRGGEGLQPTSKGARLKFSKGKPKVIDGPFTESKELIAGYLIIEVPSREEAIRWMKRWPALDADGNVTLEIRQIYEAEDFGEEFTPELREREERMRQDIEKK